MITQAETVAGVKLAMPGYSSTQAETVAGATPATPGKIAGISSIGSAVRSP
jgi:hypothetical protein